MRIETICTGDEVLTGRIDAAGRSRSTTVSSPPRQIIENRECRRTALNRMRRGRDARG